MHASSLFFVLSRVAYMIKDNKTISTTVKRNILQGKLKGTSSHSLCTHEPRGPCDILDERVLKATPKEAS